LSSEVAKEEVAVVVERRQLEGTARLVVRLRNEGRVDKERLWG